MSNDSTAPTVTPVKLTPQQVTDRHPGALWKGKRTDELDVPPTPLLPEKK